MSVERNPGEAYPSADFDVSKGEVRVRLNEGDVTIQGADPTGPVLWRVGQFWALGQAQAEAHAAIGEMTIVHRNGSPVATSSPSDVPLPPKRKPAKPSGKRKSTRGPSPTTAPSAQEPTTESMASESEPSADPDAPTVETSTESEAPTQE